VIDPVHVSITGVIAAWCTLRSFSRNLARFIRKIAITPLGSRPIRS